MESGIIQLWLAVKWLVFAAIGSGLSVLMDKTENTSRQKFYLFLLGAIISIFAGGAMIEWLNVKGPAIQGFIYWAWGLWGVGIVIQVTQQIPAAVSNLRDKFTK
jgi:hypothetical protein